MEGQGDIIYDNGAEPINVGDSILIPASLGEYRLRGNMKLVKSYVPDFEKVESEILKEVEKI